MTTCDSPNTQSAPSASDTAASPPTTATIVAICISEARGTPKRDIGAALLIADHGIEHDAHAGNWHRQVSLLSAEKVDAFRARGAVVTDGAFGENLLLSGIDLATLPIGTRLSHPSGALLEVTQIGKQCHQHCAIYDAVGDCIMPREGIFARVLVGGPIRKGDTFNVETPIPRRDPDRER